MSKYSLILRKAFRRFHLLVSRMFIVNVIKRLPASQMSRFPAIRYQEFQSMEIRAMDENLLGVFIRHKAHTLDKVSKTIWTSSKATSYAHDKSRLMMAIEEWQKRGFPITRDIFWAQAVLQRYEKWEKEKKLLEPTVCEEEREGNTIWQVIRHRRSIRYFQNKDVETLKIRQIVEAGRWAPCSSNRQAWKFIIQKRTGIGRNAAKAELDFEKERHKQGAVIIYVAIDERLYQEKYTAAMDVAAAIQNMLLMAHYLGLGGCWMYLAEQINQNKLRKRLGLEDYYYIYSAILVGHPAEVPESPPRKPLERTIKLMGFD